jgi:spore cortex formation protein SpoVR/YcgB (stage V sporulation)
VLVVAARKAWPEYQEHGLYFCQPNRSFKPVNHLAFYTDGEIKTTVPSVTGAIESIELTEEAIRNRADLSQSQREKLLDTVATLRNMGSERYGETEKVIFLQEGIELDRPVENDKTASDSDRTVAFVQGHRYVSFSKLQQNPEYTTELEETD